MLFIQAKHNGVTREYNWHIGKPSPIGPFEIAIFVSADCDELEFIRKHFDNLPIPNHKRVVKWYGDMADFIAQNL